LQIFRCALFDAYDYDEIFESGMAEGKTEGEISDMLGSPAMIAKAILDENPDNNASNLNDEGRLETHGGVYH